MKIAVLDDQPSDAAAACAALGALGHSCVAFSKGSQLIAQVQRDGVHMLIVSLQAADAATVIAWVRETLAPGLPVLAVTGNAQNAALDAALAAGVNDYQVRPLRRGELALRVETLLRRAYPDRPAPQREEFGAFAFIGAPGAPGQLQRAGQTIALTQKEFELALLLFRHLGRPLSRATIEEAVWARDAEVQEESTRTLDTHISRVRSKLGLRPENGYRLAPVYGYGYQLEQIGPPESGS